MYHVVEVFLLLGFHCNSISGRVSNHWVTGSCISKGGGHGFGFVLGVWGVVVGVRIVVREACPMTESPSLLARASKLVAWLAF
jgi:hypothetical protein